MFEIILVCISNKGYWFAPSDHMFEILLVCISIKGTGSLPVTTCLRYFWYWFAARDHMFEIILVCITNKGTGSLPVTTCLRYFWFVSLTKDKYSKLLNSAWKERSEENKHSHSLLPQPPLTHPSYISSLHHLPAQKIGSYSSRSELNTVSVRLMLLTQNVLKTIKIDAPVTVNSRSSFISQARGTQDQASP
ncbi:hypothetical protein RRG08_047557 [Elysia crispata]|uniref:Uncharacterized protein n=1 Tax=Elysia crispata TaxID=231223 RepID=A0AAE0YNR6_9GAST|nr:hypothetical protein RRG08_047557 [Elysia crispata]